MRTALSWIAGVASFAALSLALGALGNIIGVPVEVPFYDEEMDSTPTSFGRYMFVVSIMLASRVGMAVHAGSWKGGVTRHGELLYFAWLIGLSILGCVAALLFLAFRGFHGTTSVVLYYIFEVAAAAGIAWVMKTWHDLRAKASDAANRPPADLAAIRGFVSEARQCALAMVDNSSYIARELPNVVMDDVTRVTINKICTTFNVTAYDVLNELRELDGVSGGRFVPAVIRISQWLSDDVLQMHKLVISLDAAARKDARFGTAFIFVSESAVNVMNLFNRVNKSADAIVRRHSSLKRDH